MIPVVNEKNMYGPMDVALSIIQMGEKHPPTLAREICDALRTRGFLKLPEDRFQQGYDTGRWYALHNYVPMISRDEGEEYTSGFNTGYERYRP